MSTDDSYSSPAAVEKAIKAAAQKASANDPSLDVAERIRLEYFNRFLSRVFSEREGETWLLKGGTAMLARVASARGTTDVDLFRRGHSLDESLQELRRLAAIDLGDFFRFEYTKHSTSVDGNQQDYVEGYRITFDIYIGVKKKNSFHVDLVVDVVTTDEVQVVSPANALELPKLRSSPYRLYPVVDQIADKVCATLARYGDNESKREKDLVDLVVLAVTQVVDGSKLTHALHTEAMARSLDLPKTMKIPADWGVRYSTLGSR